MILSPPPPPDSIGSKCRLSLLIVFTAFVALISTIACAASDAPGGSASGLLDLVPADATFVAEFDLNELRELRDLRLTDQLYSDIRDQAEAAGMRISALDSHAGYGTAEESEIVVYGFSPDGREGAFREFRFALEDRDIEEDAYLDYELWGPGEDSQSDAFAILEEDGYVIQASSGGVKEAIRTLDRGSGSLAEAGDEPLSQLWGKLPGGFLRYSWSECMVLTSCSGVGVSVTGMDASNGDAQVQAVLLFHSEQAANNAVTDYDELASVVGFLAGGSLDYDGDTSGIEEPTISEVKADGNFVVCDVVVPSKDERSSELQQPGDGPPDLQSPEEAPPPSAAQAAQEMMQQPARPPPAAQRQPQQPARQPTAIPVLQPIATPVPAAAQPASRAAPSSPATNTDADRAALTALYHATDGPNWNYVTNWLTDAPLSEWHGVVADNNGRVVGVHLVGNGLTGTIPPELGNLSNLEELSLTQNGLTGTIPAELGNLANLRFLLLDVNNLTGTIPSELGNLSNLTALWLAQNNLTGELPESLATLPLSEINVAENSGVCAPPSLRGWLEGIYFGGHICAHAEDMAALTALYQATDGPNWNNVSNWLTDAPLSQWHGVTVGNSGRVVALNLGSNNLTGAIPPELGNISKLQLLHLNGNDLSGELPDGLAALPLEELVFLDNSGLCAPPDMAEEIKRSDRGERAQIWWEYFERKDYPDGTFTLERYAFITPVAGPICPYAVDEAALAALYHATDGPNWATVTNWLTDAPLSQWHGVTVNRNGRVTGLNLAQNGLRGTLPPELGNLSELQSLVMSGNDLTGAVPAEIGSLSRLEVIWLNQNNLTGTLPTELVNLSNLTALYIGQNNLSGELPRGLANLPLNTVLFGENPQLCAHASMRSWLESISARGRIC